MQSLYYYDAMHCFDVFLRIHWEIYDYNIYNIQHITYMTICFCILDLKKLKSPLNWAILTSVYGIEHMDKWNKNN